MCSHPSVLTKHRPWKRCISALTLTLPSPLTSPLTSPLPVTWAKSKARTVILLAASVWSSGVLIARAALRQHADQPPFADLVFLKLKRTEISLALRRAFDAAFAEQFTRVILT